MSPPPQQSLFMRFHARDVYAAIAVALFSVPLSAQKRADPPQAKNEKASEIKPWVGIRGEFDNNVFLLSPSRKGDLDAAPGSDPSGRFKNMNAASDLIVETEAGVRIHSPGIAGRSLVLAPEFRYERYIRNTERSNFTALLDVSQDLLSASRIKARIAYTPEFFAKNYLSDATDANRDGSIAPGERRYSSGKYSELDAEIAYRFRLRKAPKTGTEVRGGASLGYYSRSYQAPFANRDISGPTAGLEIGFDRSRSALVMGYDFQALSAAPGSEILILDEPAYKRDLNGNGRSTDISARTVQQVDRSRGEHSGRVSLKLDPGGPADLLVAFEHRLRIFSSSQPFDAAHLGRRDNRDEIRGEAGLKIGRDFRFTTGGRIARQTTNRAGDPGALGETDDFVRAGAFAGFKKSF